LKEEAKEMGQNSFPRITDNMRDAGVDLILEFPHCQCRLGFSNKGAARAVEFFLPSAISTLSRQIEESRQYGLYRLFVLLVSEAAESRSAKTANTIAKTLTKLKDPYVTLIPPVLLFMQ
jgi:hypothetical protein